ncbi:hypothetical protein Misp02_55340 [Microtetraspora sp. NBRC 16547]|nr:hypothetical protein Misp02_55340 [Microtetraspora sp. NBRC 16547]
MAINASTTWPWLTRATSRIGHNPSTTPAIPSRPQKSAIIGSDPNAFSTLGGPYITRVFTTHNTITHHRM